MDFLTLLGKYEKQDVTKVKKIIESENKKIDAILKEAFFGTFVSKAEAKIRVEQEFTDKDLAPDGIDVNYVNENLKKIQNKIDLLTEASIKIIINNNESQPAQPAIVSLPIPDMEIEEGNKGKKRGRGRPKKVVDYNNEPDEIYKDTEAVGELSEEGDIEDEIEVVEEEKKEEVEEGCGYSHKEKIRNEEEDESEEETDEKKKIEEEDDVLDDINKEVGDEEEEVLDEPEEVEGDLKWTEILDKLKTIEDKVDTLVGGEDEESDEETDNVEEISDDEEEEIEESGDRKYNLHAMRKGLWGKVNKQPMSQEEHDKMKRDIEKSGIAYDELRSEIV